MLLQPKFSICQSTVAFPGEGDDSLKAKKEQTMSLSSRSAVFTFCFAVIHSYVRSIFKIIFQNIVSFTISSSTSFPRIPFSAVLGCSTPCLPSYWAAPSTCTMRTGVDTLSAWLHLPLIHEAFLHYCWSKKELFKANVEIGRKGKDVNHKLVDLLLPETLFQCSIILTLLYQYKSSI